MSRLVLGLGGTVDYEIAWDSSVIEELIAAYDVRAEDLTTWRPVQSERDLLVAVLAFMSDGAGGERFVASSELIAQFAGRFDKRITLGGTPVRAAAAMRALGVTSKIHLVSIDDHVRRLLPEGCTYLCSADDDSTDPHLIVQYGKGARVRAADIDICAPHANRVILANDPPNLELRLSPDLPGVLADAEVFLISGFNVMQSADLLDERLGTIKECLRQLPPEATVFYEDSGFHVPALSGHVRAALIEDVDVYSMNEDEMQAYLGRSLDLLDPGQMAVALGELQALIPAKTLVVHTKYWALALGRGAAGYEDCLRGGITMATTRYRHGDVYGEDEYRGVALLPVNAAGAAFATALQDLAAAPQGSTDGMVCCVPAFVVEVDRPTTIGLGDTFVGGFLAALATRPAVARA